MPAYYNEIDPHAAQWLRNLIAAGHIAPGDVDERSIVEVQPDDLRGYQQCHFFAGIGGWSLALRLAGWPDHRPVWSGSCPCFPAGTLVLTTDGYKPIETVAVGDLVLTHQGRFRAVLEVGSDVAECVVVKGQGHHGLVCTPGHPFLVGNDEWCEAKDLKGRRWANVAQVPEVPVPAMVPTAKGHFYDKASKGYRVKGDKGGKPVYVGLFGTVEEAAAVRTEAIRDGRIDVRGANAADVWSPGFARFLGYWIGDGWVSRDHVFLCGAVGDADLLEQLFAGAKLLGKATLEPTSSRIRCGSKHFVRWLREQFGEYAHGKKIPAWLYGMPEEYRRAFLDGYLLADGHEETGKRGGGRVRVFTTVSKALAIGVRVLLNQLGASASIRVINNQRQAVIDGRPVSERPSYKVTAYETVRSFRLLGRHGWGLVRSVEPAGTHTVYNLAVDEDESYTADGIVVHNCQPFSTAGKQRGCEDDRHLWPTFFRLIRECRPASIFGEQVAGINGLAWIDHVFADLENQDYAVGAADLPACGAGAPHRRQRLFWVANAKSKRGCWRESRPDGTTKLGRSGETDWMANSHRSEQQTRDRITRTKRQEDVGCLGAHGLMGNPMHTQRRKNDERSEPDGCHREDDGRQETFGFAGARRQVFDLADPESQRHEGRILRAPGRGPQERAEAGGAWDDLGWLTCSDGKSRPSQPGIFPLVDGVSQGVVRGGDRSMAPDANQSAEARTMRLKGYGNAIVPQVAAIFITAAMQSQ